MPVEVVDAAAVNRKGFMKMAADHTWVLDIPRWPPPADPCIPVMRVSRSVSVPEDEITEIPLHSRIGILVEPFLHGRPSGHVEAEEFPEPREFQWVEIDIPVVPISDL